MKELKWHTLLPSSVPYMGDDETRQVLHCRVYEWKRISNGIAEHVNIGQSGENMVAFNTLSPEQNVQHFADDIFECIFFTDN